MTDQELIEAARGMRAGPGQFCSTNLAHCLADALAARQWPLAGPQCDGCDYDVMPTWAYCAYCGHPLPTPPETKP